MKRFFTYFLTTVFILFFLAHSDAQYDPTAGKLMAGSPESVGMSSDHLHNIDELCEQYFKNEMLPGGTVLVARHGKVIYFKAWGQKDINSEAPYATEDIFRIASMTKAFTSVAILQLVEEGKIMLDEPIGKYIPSLKDVRVLDQFNPADSSYTAVPAKSAITIRHLLSHTSGITYDFMDPRIGAVYTKNKVNGFGLSHPTYTTEEMVNLIATQPLAHHPGENWSYGYNDDVLGYLIEVVTGKNLGHYCRENIFDPLGMNDTYFYLPEEKANRLVPAYYQNENGLGLYEENIFDYPTEKRNHFAGGGGASSTTMDYAIFCQALLNGGQYQGNRILSRKTIDLMITDQLEFMGIEPGGLLGKNGTSFGLGFSLRTEKNQAYNLGSMGSYLWGGAFNTKFWIDPKEDMVFVGMTQIYPNSHPEFWEKMNAIIFSAIVD